MQITLRPSTPDDVEFIKDVYTKAYGPKLEAQYRTLHPRAIPFFLSRQEDDIKAGKFKIILADSEECGYISCEEKDVSTHVRLLILHPDYHGKGIGKKVMQEMQKTAKIMSKGISLNVLKTNSAFEFYKNLGFKTARDPKREPEQPEDEHSYYMAWEG